MIDPTLISQSNTILSEIAEAIGSDLHPSETENFSRQSWLAIVVAHNTDISLFWSRLVIWLLVDPTYGVIRYYSEGVKEIEQVATLFRQVIEGKEPLESQWKLAAEEARIIAVALVDNKSREASQKFKAAMCACLAAHAMAQEKLQTFGEEELMYFTVIDVALQAAFEAGGKEWSYQVAIAIKDKFLDLIWESEVSAVKTYEDGNQ